MILFHEENKNVKAKYILSTEFSWHQETVRTLILNRTFKTLSEQNAELS